MHRCLLFTNYLYFLQYIVQNQSNIIGNTNTLNIAVNINCIKTFCPCITRSYNKNAALKANFEDKIASLLKQLHWWKARKLSLTGKFLIVKP